MRYVGVGRRAVAQIVDLLLLSVVALPFAKIEHLSAGGYQATWTGVGAAFPSLISLAYFIVLEGLFGATLGKLLLGIRTVRADGAKMGWGASVVRNALRVVDAFPYVIPYLVGAIAIWTDGPTDRRLGDRAAGTVVIRKGSTPEDAGRPAMPMLVDHPVTAYGGGPLPPPPPSTP